jgi:hypothetical protein
MAYPTLDQVKAWIVTAGDDTNIRFILDGIIAAVEQYCGRSFITNTVTQEYPARAPYVTQSRTLLTMFEDLTSVTSLTNGDGTVIAAADYELIPPDGPPYYQIRLKPQSGEIFQEDTDGTLIELVGNLAYSATCPDDIFTAILNLVDLTYAGKQDGAGTSVTAQGVIIDKSVWPKSITDILDRRKR